VGITESRSRRCRAAGHGSKVPGGSGNSRFNPPGNPISILRSHVATLSAVHNQGGNHRYSADPKRPELVGNGTSAYGLGVAPAANASRSPNARLSNHRSNRPNKFRQTQRPAAPIQVLRVAAFLALPIPGIAAFELSWPRKLRRIRPLRCLPVAPILTFARQSRLFTKPKCPSRTSSAIPSHPAGKLERWQC
jgi:hypothetical protein